MDTEFPEMGGFHLKLKNISREELPELGAAYVFVRYANETIPVFTLKD